MNVWQAKFVRAAVGLLCVLGCRLATSDRKAAAEAAAKANN